MNKVIRVDFSGAGQRRLEHRSERIGRELAAVQRDIDRALDKVEGLLSSLEDGEDEF